MTNHNVPAATAGGWNLGGDLDVHRVGFGAMPLTGWPAATRRPDRDTALSVLRRTAELGVNHIDTCHYYSRDGVAANELIRSALHPYPDGLVIATKVGPILRAGEDLPPGQRLGIKPENLRLAVETNLAELGVERLDLVNLRWDGAVTPQEGSLEESLETLAALREEGLIRHLGISNVGLAKFEAARKITDIVCVQNRYSIGFRKHEEIVDACEAAGIAFVPFFPVSGFDDDITARVRVVADRHGATVPQVALAWLLARSPSILLIPGTGSPAHLEENVAAGALRLTADDLRELV